MTDSDDQLFSNFLKYFRRIDAAASADSVRALYDATDDKAWLKTCLSKFTDNTFVARRTETPNVAAFKYSTPATLFSYAIVALIHVKLDLPELGLEYKGEGGGLFGGVVARSWGTFYYNNLSDLSGQSDFECNFATAWANLNLIRSGQTYGMYQGGGIPFAGIGGGNGQWGPIT